MVCLPVVGVTVTDDDRSPVGAGGSVGTGGSVGAGGSVGTTCGIWVLVICVPSILRS